MRELEKGQELAPDKVAMLAAMGIQVWHARSAANASDQKDAEPREAEPRAAGSRLHTASQSTPQTPSPSSVPSSRVGTEALRALREESANTPAVEAVIPPTAIVPEQQETTKPATETIEFAWVKGALGMVLLAPGAGSDMVQLVRDIVVYGDWLQQRKMAAAKPQGGSGRSSTGDFRWPQLLDTGGTPARALSVFIDKHLPDDLDRGRGWVALAEEVATTVSPWLQDLPVDIIKLPALHAHMGDAAIKRQIWSSLRRGG